MLISFFFRFPAFCEISFPQSLFMGKCHFYVKYSHLLSRLYHWIYSISFIVVEGILFPLLIRFYIFLAIIDIFPSLVLFTRPHFYIWYNRHEFEDALQKSNIPFFLESSSKIRLYHLEIYI